MQKRDPKVDELQRRLAKAHDRVRAAQNERGAYGFLPDIGRVLTQMAQGLELDREIRDRIASGLGRLVTDNYTFSESDLGQELLGVADDFAQL